MFQWQVFMPYVTWYIECVDLYLFLQLKCQIYMWLHQLWITTPYEWKWHAIVQLAGKSNNRKSYYHSKSDTKLSCIHAFIE